MQLNLAIALSILFFQIYCSHASGAADGTGCWSKYNFSQVSIGIHFGLGKCTAAVVFPNGTLTNLASIATNPSDRDWMLQQIRWGKSTMTQWSHLYAQLLKRISPTPGPSDRRRQPFLDSLKALRKCSENYLGLDTPFFTISYPSYLDAAQVRHLSNSLADANIHDSGCHSLASSSRAATWSHRQALGLSSPLKTVTECIHGDFGTEKVIFIEHEEETLTVELFELYVSNDKAEVGPSSNNLKVFLKPHHANDRVDKFWGEVTAHFQTLLIPSHDTSNPENIYRLVITGTLANDARLLETPSSSADELFPSPGTGLLPLAARMFFTPATEKEVPMEDRKGFWCNYKHDPTKPLRTFFGNLMLARIQQDLIPMIDPLFASARGAALLGIDSRLRPCSSSPGSERCDLVSCSEKREPEEGWWFESAF